jgi:hypothetical protein
MLGGRTSPVVSTTPGRDAESGPGKGSSSPLRLSLSTSSHGRPVPGQRRMSCGLPPCIRLLSGLPSDNHCRRRVMIGPLLCLRCVAKKGGSVAAVEVRQPSTCGAASRSLAGLAAWPSLEERAEGAARPSVQDKHSGAASLGHLLGDWTWRLCVSESSSASSVVQVPAEEISLDLVHVKCGAARSGLSSDRSLPVRQDDGGKGFLCFKGSQGERSTQQAAHTMHHFSPGMAGNDPSAVPLRGA